MSAVEKLLKSVGDDLAAGQIGAARRKLERAAADETALGALAAGLLSDLDGELASAQLSVNELLGDAR